jgi:Domain of unknown function (DUF4878)
MRSYLLFGFLFLQFFCACGNNDKNAPASENDVDAARNFIQSALNGDYRKAKSFMVQDSLNIQLLNAVEDNYQHRTSREDKRGYRESSINVHDIRPVSDSVSIVQYSNSFKKEKDSLKVVKLNGQWLIDLKYSFHVSDSVKNQPY